MPLDPATRQLIDLLEENFPRIGTEVHDAAEARRILAAAPERPGVPIPVAEVENRTIPGPAGAPEIPVRIYRPETAEATPPVVVFCHGGGWVLCDLDSHDQQCRALTNGAEAVVVSVDYRLAPEHRFPAALDDAYATATWVAGHGDELGVDTGRLAVAGDSAGGNLAAATALMARDRGGPPIVCQLLIYAVLDHAGDTASYRENAQGYFLTADHMRWFSEQYLGGQDPTAPYAAPLRADDLTGLPPAYIVTGEFDPLRDEGEAYAARLAEAGVPVTARRYDGMFHGFFGFTEFLPVAKEAAEDAFAALRATLRQ